ncbi:MAG: TerC family protein [Rhodospirillales bacterium]|nr:TerC family protein [Rhodospirillales bacterium]
MEFLTDPNMWASLATLAALEIVLGVDNLIFISIVAAKLDPSMRQRARQIGLGLALFMRIGLLAGISWVVGLTQPIFSYTELTLSWRDVILIGGGLFLLAKSTTEIHHTLEGAASTGPQRIASTFPAAIGQIAVLDLVFSLDSIITAVGMAQDIWVMIAAVALAMIVMVFAAKPVTDFVDRHPTVKMLALSFLLLIGVALIAEGFGAHVPRGYLYFAVAFSVAVELLNLYATKKTKKN